MDQWLFEQKVNELVRELGPLPELSHEKVRHLSKSKAERSKKGYKNVTSLHESLDYLRVSVKYVLFDLEATRRENTYLKRLLEEQD